MATDTPAPRPVVGRRALALELSLVFAVAFAWLSLRPSAPLHDDTSRDLAFARELVDGDVLHLHGAWASFGGLLQGTSWIDLLALGQRLGLSVAGIEVVLTVLLAASVAMLDLGLHRTLAPGSGSGRRVAPIVGALVFLAALPIGCEMPILWQPLLLPVPIVLAHLALWRLVRAGAWLDALALALWGALAIDVHVVSVAVVVPMVAAVPLASGRPVLATMSALAVGLGTLALCSPAALTSNLAIVRAQGWLISSAAVLVLALVIGFVGRRWFARASGSARSWVMLLAELALLGLLAAASLSEATPGLTGRYLLPFAPALALLAARLACFARGRVLAGVAVLLAGGVLASSYPALRPRSQRELPLVPAWRIAEFQPFADALVERGVTWTELAGSLQGPELMVMLGHLSTQVAPGSAEPPHPSDGLLLIGLPPADADVVLGQTDSATILADVAFADMRAVLLRTTARADRLGAQLCRDGGDCEALVLAATSRVSQAHADAWIGPRPAAEWLTANGRAAPAEHMLKFPISSGPASLLLLPTRATQECAWLFVATEGFASPTTLPSPVLELPPDASGSVLISRKRDPEGCQQSIVLFPPSIVETTPAQERLRELLTPTWASAGLAGPE